ncbi:protein KRI1-like [Brassica napus]|uniref:protein KRI1-like n=1 Tax=Brassica napus TaxID=3708 RepID=UPI002078D23B|nr:protein KRI1-like [Brassica napus]
MSQSLTSSNKNRTTVQEEEDDDLVILPDVDNSELIARYRLSLVGRLFNRERRNVEALIALLPRPSIWDVEGRVRGVDLGNHRFQFDFDSEDDLQKVLSKRPCHFNKWSFALERWAPHIGDSFPNTMTFWVSAMGIPTHFWLEPIFRALGKRLGHVGLVEAKTAKFEVELNADLPIKFALRAQLPTGEIVPVSLEYGNLHRWCHSCRLLSHEDENCPQLSEKEKEKHRLAKEVNRDQGLQPRNDNNRKDINRNGDLPKRHNVAEQKLSSHQERRSGEGPQRDNRDSVWKRIDSRYAPRDDHRGDNRNAHRDRDKPTFNKETYNKRRYDDSFASSRQRVDAKKAEKKLVSETHGSKEVPEGPRALHLDVCTQGTTSDQNQLACRSISSPEHVRERPFMLSLQKRSSGELKLKEKVGDFGDSSDTVSSAKKSLRFAAENNPSSPKPNSSPPAQMGKKKEKSWYEQTLEEDEMTDHTAETNINKEIQDDNKEFEDPNAERILEEEDWMNEDATFDIDEDDLMDEDELLYDEKQQEEEPAPPSDRIPLPLIIEGSTESGKETKEALVEESPKQSGLKTSVIGSRCAQLTPGRSSRSSTQKKRGTPSPTATGVSLRQRNLMVGRASSKAKVSKSGPKLNQTLSPDQGQDPSDFEKADLLLKNNKKSAKVGSNKPPKIPR